MKWTAPLIAWWLVCGFVYAHIPPSPDQGLVDYMGWMLLHGGVQYVDFIDMNWPGGVWLHAIATAIFGVSVHSWRILDFALMLGAIGCGASASRDIHGRDVTGWMLVLYPLIYATLGIWAVGQRDTVAAHLVLVAFFCHTLAWQRQRLTWQLIGGVALGAAIVVKPTLGFAGPILVLHGVI